MSDKLVKDGLWTPSFFAACGANVCMFFAFYMIMPILPMYIIERFMVDESVAGMVLSSYIIMALLFRPFAGFMVDSFPRKALMIICYTSYIAFFGGYMLAGTLALFAIMRATHGLTFGMATVSMNTVAVDIMPAFRRGEGIGYFGVTTNIAMAIGPMAALMLYEKYNNYDLIFGISLAVGLLGLLCTLCIKNRHKVVPGGDRVMSLDRFILIRALPVAGTLALISFNYGALTSYVAVFTKERMEETGSSALFFVFMAIGLVVSRLTGGKIINGGHLPKVALVGMVVLLPSFLLFVFAPQAIWYYAAATGIGMGYGLIVSAFQTMFISLAAHNQRGTATATYLASWDLGVGLGVLFGGVIASWSSYAMAYVVGTGLLTLGLLIFAFFTARYYSRTLQAFSQK